MAFRNTNAAASDCGDRQLNCSRQEEPASINLAHAQARAARKNEPLRCPICKRRFQRRARQQSYCSPRCMRKANYARKASLGLLSGQHAALVPDPLKSKSKINVLETANRRSSARIIGPRDAIQVEVIDARKWAEVISTSGVRSYVSRLSVRALRDEGTP